MRIDTLFVDKGGVLVDNRDDLAPQWRRLIGEFLSPRLGGTAAAWGDANVPAFHRQVERWQAAMRRGGPADIRGFFANDAPVWLRDMCDAMAIAPPPEADAVRLASETVSYIKAHLVVRVPRRGLDALRALRARGVVLHVASGDAHADLVDFLVHIGARELFDRVYGSDVVDTWKSGPDYYRAILDDSGVDPARAGVVDDSPKALSWAHDCGLRGFLVARRGSESFDDAVTRTVTEVASAL
ncbi:MAG TPA: HAD family hydrolase [Candidatus Limnocylindria bacterium]|nr:HAD family hydrolase [Candidatus Limnocylindria bacterium]